MVTILLGRTP